MNTYSYDDEGGMNTYSMMIEDGMNTYSYDDWRRNEYLFIWWLKTEWIHIHMFNWGGMNTYSYDD